MYERTLSSFLELNSNFIQQNENGDASLQSVHNYTIQISNLSCVKQNRYKNCFIVSPPLLLLFPDMSNSPFSPQSQRVLFDNQVRETAVRSSSMIQQATSWDGVLTFSNIQVQHRIAAAQMCVRMRCIEYLTFVFHLFRAMRTRSWSCRWWATSCALYSITGAHAKKKTYFPSFLPNHTTPHNTTSSFPQLPTVSGCWVP